MLKKINLLMTGAGAPGAAGIIRCLREMEELRIISADANPDAVGRYLSDEFVKIPLATDKHFADELVAICREKKIDIVLPLVTKELIPFAVMADALAAVKTKVLISPFTSLEIANDKSKLYQFIEWRGLPVPAYRIVENVDQFKTAANELGYPDNQICFKPSVSNGSRGFRILAEKIDELDILFNYKPDSKFLTLANAARILSKGRFPELLVSEYLPGDEYSVDCLAKHGEPVVIVPRLRKKMIGGISVEGEFVKNDEIINYCTKIIRELQLHGNIGIQVKASKKDEFLLLEINPRVQGTISSALGAGVNLPLLAVKQQLDLPIQASDLQIQWGRKFSRYWNEVFY